MAPCGLPLPVAEGRDFVIYGGRDLDPVALWEEFVDFPPSANLSGGFAPLTICPNPEHGSNKKHFQVNLDKPLVHCFALCGISGTYEHAIAMIKGVTEKDARRYIRQRTKIDLGAGSKRKLRDQRGRARRRGARVVEEGSLDALAYDRYLPPLASEYLSGRGITASSIARYGIGWDEDERRIVIPADDERGITRFLIKRAVREKDWPKYLYAPEGVSKTALLFGACHLDSRSVSSDGLVLVEGSIDQIANLQDDVQAGAILGTGLSDRQAAIISKMRPKRIICMYDRDLAGVRNVQMTAAKLTKIPIFVCLYPKGKSDPAELSRKEKIRAIENAVSLVAFQRRMREVKLSGPKRKEIAYG